jgi:biopolymer transport protein ExbD
MEFERRRRRHGHIDIAPLVDVVFNLLLFFVITYNVTAEPAIRIRLPESKTAQSGTEQQVVITLTRDGATFVGEKPVSLESIPDVVRELWGADRQPAVRIKADEGAPVGLLIRVIDGVKLAGCSAFHILTEKKD